MKIQSKGLLPEWSPVNAVLLAWPYADGDWSENLIQAERCYYNMLQQLCNHTQVVVLVHPSIDTQTWQRKLRARFNPDQPYASNALASNPSSDLANAYQQSTQCQKSFIQIEKNLIPIFGIPYNDTWVRDYAPLSFCDTLKSFTFNGWGNKYPHALDNAVANILIAALKTQAHRGFTKPLNNIDFVLEGGAIEVNGEGDVLVNKTCVVHQNRNENTSLLEHEDVLKKELGVSNIIWLNIPALSGDDTDGHVDTMARFVASDHIFYSAPNPKHPDNAKLEQLNTQIQSICSKQTWHAQPLPTPVVYSAISSGSLLPATYANFLLCNDTIFLPIYGVEEDSIAINIFESFTRLENPFKTIVPIRCEALLEQNGSLHCATMQFT